MRRSMLNCFQFIIKAMLCPATVALCFVEIAVSGRFTQSDKRFVRIKLFKKSLVAGRLLSGVCCLAKNYIWLDVCKYLACLPPIIPFEILAQCTLQSKQRKSIRYHTLNRVTCTKMCGTPACCCPNGKSIVCGFIMSVQFISSFFAFTHACYVLRLWYFGGHCTMIVMRNDFNINGMKQQQQQISRNITIEMQRNICVYIYSVEFPPIPSIRAGAHDTYCIHRYDAFKSRSTKIHLHIASTYFALNSLRTLQIEKYLKYI